MWVSLAFLVMLLAIAYRQATFGFFSALIMTVLTVCCAAGAVGVHEWLASIFAEYWQPSYAHALSLSLSFGVSLLILRVIFDKVIRRACLLPAMIDRIGGGICGLITALLMVGVMAASIQMIPFGGSILGFQRVEVIRPEPGTAPPKSSQSKENNLWLSPDRFLAGAAYYTSAGVFSSENLFYKDYPDWIQAVGWVSSAPEGMSTYAKPGSIVVQGVQKIDRVYRMIPGSDRERTPPMYEPIEAKGGNEFRMLRIKLQEGAKDQNKAHLFTPRQFRLVGNAGKKRTQYHGMALPQEQAAGITKHVSVRKDPLGEVPVTDLVFTPGEGDLVEIVFEVPAGFEADFVEYKRGARARVPAKESVLPPPETSAQPGSAGTAPPEGTAAAPSTGAAPPAGTESSGRPSRPSPPSEERRGGNIRTFTTQAGKSFFSDQLPLELKDYRSRNAEIERGKLAAGHLIGEVDKQAAGTGEPISKFDVPADKRLLQLNVGALHARSGLGRAISFAVGTLQNYFVEDANGNRYELVGKYAIAKVGDAQVVEVQYFKDKAGTVGQIGAFERIKERDLQGDYQLYMLFLVDPGAHITAFSTGGDATRKDDLTAENLVAPR